MMARNQNGRRTLSNTGRLPRVRQTGTVRSCEKFVRGWVGVMARAMDIGIDKHSTARPTDSRNYPGSGVRIQPTISWAVRDWFRSPPPCIMEVMRRARWFRFLSALLAIWVPLSIGEPSALRLCPAHAVASVSTGSGSHHHSTAAVATPADGASQHGAPSDAGAHHCSCIAGCSISVAAVAVPDAPIAAVIVAEHNTSGFSATAPSRARPTPEFAHPHPTGPPRA
jgi:hypothetical protein